MAAHCVVRVKATSPSRLRVSFVLPVFASSIVVLWLDLVSHCPLLKPIPDLQRFPIEECGNLEHLRS